MLLRIISILLMTLPMYAIGNDSPVGLWTTIDDETKTPKSLVEITLMNGVLSGKIIELYNPSEPNPLCKKCQDERANQPIQGMTIIWDTVKQEEGDSWKGFILDPKKGKTYKVKLTLEEQGKQLKVRGYVGNPMFGRTQYWQRN